MTLGKLQASKAQLSGVTLTALQAMVPEKPIMVRGLKLLGMRPKQLYLDWAASAATRGPRAIECC